MQIQVLGGLTVRHGSAVLTLGTPKQQTVLAVLAGNPAGLVSVDQLVDELWPTDPPRSAVPNVRTYAANLRRGLEAMIPEREVLTRARDGYRLDVARTDVDAFLFRSEVAEARRLVAADQAGAARLLSRALERWRGPALVGVPLGSMLSAQVAALIEDRMLAAEMLVELKIRLGHYDDALPVLRNLLVTQPLRERAHLLLVRALHLRGDHAGAIAAYHAARRILREQLGIEPGAELRQLYLRITEHEWPGSHTDRAARPGVSTSVGHPDQGIQSPSMPPAVPDFVGRGKVVEQLLSATLRAVGGTPAVHLVDGMAGSGKTSLALHVAARLTTHYPDGQLFIDLKGHNAVEQVDLTSALATLLRQLGVPGGRIPAAVEDRLSCWQGELASRRLIIVLDNAAGAGQVFPLLPRSRGSVVIVTSRRRITGLDVGPPVSLPMMAVEEGVALLATSAGPERVAAEPTAAALVVEQCGYLPLAIRLAGSRLAHRPTWQVADLAALLAGNARRLVHLTSGDRSVTGAFAASYEPLDEPARRMFRLFSVHPGDHFDLVAAIALSGLAPDDAGLALTELVDCHLVDEVKPGRYRMHDLIRQFADELSREQDSAQERERAFVELADVMLHLCFQVADDLESGSVRKYVTIGSPRRPDLLVVAASPTEEWAEDQRANLVALVVRAREWACHDHAWRLARVLWRFLYVRGYFDDIIVTHLAGLAAAQAAKDEAAMAVMHNYVASAYLRKGSFEAALQHVRAAVINAEQRGDVMGAHGYRVNLVAVHWIRGDPEEAVRVGLESLRGQQGHEISTLLPNVGLALAMVGRNAEALHLHRLHLYLARQAGSQFHLLNALGHIGTTKFRLGRHEAAVRALRAALALRRRTGHRYAEAEVRNDLGIALRCLGRTDEAVRHHEAARRLAVESGEPHVEAAALNDLAFTLVGTGDPGRVVELHRAALRVATRIAHLYEQGRALTGLAEHLFATDPVAARRHWERALAIFRRMGVPERFEVERRLAEIAAE
ncbi:AfsR/SARP family transcriptional regulator [Micromonospora radicis]|uniref:AfsR/SARP family transcriptional regulator n=1 Tax=Micromonospora radicis TaxID=1894971 RepID=UPI0013146BE1|nr:AfsR/SARP family transcriptional regulator [Micromonospora radicis]